MTREGTQAMSRRHERAFSIAELVLALAITGMIGLSVTGVYMVLSTAQAHTDEHYEHLQSSAGVRRLLERTLRRSRLVLAAGSDGLALWAGDDNDKPGAVLDYTNFTIANGDPNEENSNDVDTKVQAAITVEQPVKLNIGGGDDRDWHALISVVLLAKGR